jgi:hypothetical protein
MVVLCCICRTTIAYPLSIQMKARILFCKGNAGFSGSETKGSLPQACITALFDTSMNRVHIESHSWSKSYYMALVRSGQILSYVYLFVP